MPSSLRLHRGPLTRAIVFENPDPSLDGLLRDQGFEVVRVRTTPDKQGVIDLLREHRPHLLFKRSRLEIDGDVLDASPELFAVMLCCIGDDSVDKQAAADRGVLVCNDPRSNGRSVAELVIGQMIMGARRIPDAWRETRDSRWLKSATGRFELKGKCLGIYGLGNIGKQVARLGEAMGMDILFYDVDEVARGVGETMDWAAAASARDLFAGSDFVTVHLSAEDPHARSNSGAVVRELLMALGEDRPVDSPRVFLNLGRGFLLDPADLLAAVAAGKVGHAFVDVFPEEPEAGAKTWQNPYAGEPAVHCTPHIGAATRDAQPRIARKMAHTARRFSQHATVEDCVFSPRHTIDVANTAEAAHVLAVVHSDDRGTKKAIDDIIYRAGIDNLQSAHRDFGRFGLAYDLTVLSRPLTDGEVEQLVAEASSLTGRPDAIRVVRQVTLTD